MEKISRQGFIGPFRNADRNDLPQPIDADMRADQVLARAQLADGALPLVVLVADVAHDLLEDVLDRHDAHGPAVLVDDHGHRLAALLHLQQQIVGGLAGGHVEELPEGRADGLGGRGGQLLQDIEGIDHTDDVDDIAPVDGESGEARLVDESSGIPEGRLVLEGRHIGDRHHDPARARLGEIEDALHHDFLRALDIGVRRFLQQKILETVLGNVRQGSFPPLACQDVDGAAGDLRDQKHQGVEDP